MTVLHNPRLLESADVERQTWRADYDVICEFLTSGMVTAPKPHIVQGSGVYHLLEKGKTMEIVKRSVIAKILKKFF